jgi:O-antigen ligase
VTVDGLGAAARRLPREPLLIGSAVLLALAVGTLAAGAPVRAALAVLVVAAVIACLVRPDYALYLVVALTPLESAVQISSNEQLSATKLAGALSFASFALYILVGRRRLHLDRTHVTALLLLAVAMISTLQAQSMSEAMTATTRLASFVVLYVVVTHLASSRRVLVGIVWTFAASSALAGAMGSYNFLSSATHLARLKYGDPNDFAFVLAAALPFAMWLLIETQGWRRLSAGVMIGLLAAGIVLSLSRGAVLAVGVGVMWHAVSERRHRKLLVVAVTVSAMSALLFIQSNPERVAAGLSAKEYVAQDNVDSRLVAWNGALKLASEHPVLGIGPGNFGLYYYEISGNPVGTFALAVSHNAYLDVASELGLAGLLLFLAFIVLSFIRLSTAASRGLGPPGLASLCRTSLIIVLVCFITMSEQYFAPLWLLGALGTALHREPASESST